jgi:hypothetical protein
VRTSHKKGVRAAKKRWIFLRDSRNARHCTTPSNPPRRAKAIHLHTLPA